MDNTDRTILENAADPNGYMPTTADLDRVLALHEKRLLSRERVDGGLWVYRITEKGREALRGEVLAPAAITPATVPYDEITDPTQALLWFADEGHYEGTYRRGAGFADALGIGIARRVLGLPADRVDGSLMPLAEALEQRQTAVALTPEVVLRAMLKAYEAAALDAAIQRARIGNGGRARFPVAEFEDCAMVLREAVGAVLAGSAKAEEYFRLRRDFDLLADYEARLAGTRPLDAPPLEVL